MTTHFSDVDEAMREMPSTQADNILVLYDSDRLRTLINIGEIEAVMEMSQPKPDGEIQVKVWTKRGIAHTGFIGRHLLG